MPPSVNRQQLARDQLSQGLHVLQAGEPALARPMLEAAVSLAPDWVDTHYNLAVAHARLGDYDAAERACRAALDLEPNSAATAHLLGAVITQAGRHEEALTWLARSVAMAPNLATSRRDLGVIHLFLGDLDLARENLLAALELDPTCPQVLPVLVELTAGDEAPAQRNRIRNIMRRMTEAAEQLNPAQQIDLLYGLGRFYEQRGEPANAFAAYSRGNKLRRAQFEFSSDESDARLASIAATFSPALFERLKGSGLQTNRPIFIVGMPRSGTTLVEQIISAHPQVQAAGESMAMMDILIHSRGPGGELYPGWVPYMNARDCAATGEAYLSGLPHLEAGKSRITDKRLENTEHLGLIHLALPNAPIIHCLRDPRDCLFSCYTTQFLGGQPWSYDLQEIARYWKAQQDLVRHWRQVLPPGRFMTVSYEALVEDLEGWARRILDHCGLEWDPACLEFHKSRRPVTSASAAQVRKPIYDSSIGRWRQFAKQLEPLLRTL